MAVRLLAARSSASVASARCDASSASTCSVRRAGEHRVDAASLIAICCLVRAPVRRRDCPSGWRLRWSPAARIGPVSRKEQIAPTRRGARTLAVLLPASPQRSPAARARSATVARRPASPRACATSRQIVAASSSRGASSSRSAPLMVIESRSGEREQPFGRAVQTPIIGGSSGGGARRKCALTIARNCGRRREVRAPAPPPPRAGPRG